MPAARRTWPFIGREPELAQIASARSEPDVPGVVVLAEAGMGKTALARAAANAAAAQGVTVEWVQATRSAATIPLAAFAGLIPPGVRSADALALMEGTAAGLRDRTRNGRAMLVVDDAQRLDEQSAALLVHLVLGDAAFVLCTVRTGEPVPDAIEALWKDLRAERLGLEPLDPATSVHLLEAALGGPVAAATQSQFVQASPPNGTPSSCSRSGSRCRSSRWTVCDTERARRHYVGVSLATYCPRHPSSLASPYRRPSLLSGRRAPYSRSPSMRGAR